MTTALQIALLLLVGMAGTARAETPQWIWTNEDRAVQESVCLRAKLEVDEQLRSAELIAVADYCHSATYLNGQLISRDQPYGRLLQIDLAKWLAGENTLTFCCRSAGGPAAVMVRVELRYANGRTETIVSSPAWQAAKLQSDDLRLPAATLTWHSAVGLGTVAAYRWGLEPDTVRIAPVDDYQQWKRASAAKRGADPNTFQVAEGFKVELIRSAATDEDSWIALVEDPKGRWIIGMEKQGLLRLTLPESEGGTVRVERINKTLRECRGLVFAHGSLYAMANGDKSMFRLHETDNNDRFDRMEKLVEFSGDSGHGRNQLTLGPEGQVWGIFGDSVFEPEQAGKLPPVLANPTEAESTRSGFVARFNADASQMAIVVRGLRNPFGLDFNEHGELFTYDADAEYDMGFSWYRPTRIYHLLPGGDHRWRSVTREWPPYFPDRADMPQPTLNVGKGSPTAVEFGYASDFPPRYREALFALDWAYGRILAVHLTPRGASYHAAAETFLRGQPLNVTDLEFGRDGAMYFITGGRGTQSALYRVTYIGSPVKSKATLQQRARRLHAEEARRIRRQLEKGLENPAHRVSEGVRKNLGHEDPWIRHAARAALEKVPVDAWRAQVLEERARGAGELSAALSAQIAWARRTREPLPPITGFSELFADASERTQLEMLYLAERQFANQVERVALAELHELYPSMSWPVNKELSRVLSLYPNEHFVAKTLSLLEQASDQQQQLHYLYVLRHVRAGWTPQWRQAYFAQLQQMDDFVGGEGMPTFRRLIREEAIAALPESDRAKYQELLEAKPSRPIAELPPARTGLVRRWTVAELAEAWSGSSVEPNANNGEQMFAVARCVACHRCGGQGGTSGPDLSAVAQRFSLRDILTAIVEPSRVISEKYAAETFELHSGRVVTGRIAPGDYRSPQLEIIPNLLEPEKKVSIAKADIVARTTSPVSVMPSGLVDSLTEKEVLDLLAFLLQGSGKSVSQSSP